MYHQSNITNGPVRKYIDNSGTSGNNIGLYRRNNPNPKHNLISAYSLQSESGLSKSFQFPLRSLRYNIDSTLPESSRGENNSNMDRYVSKNVLSRNKCVVDPSFNRHHQKYENLSPIPIERKGLQQEAGLLTPSTRYNLNLNPKMYADINSPGFCGRVAEKLNETLTHQAKYPTVGAFPIVNLNCKSHKPYLSYRNSQIVAKPSVRVRIAPPDMSLRNSDRRTCIGSDESMNSLHQVLKEISRKRIHSQENEDDDNTKRIRTTEFEAMSIVEQQSPQGKRPREDSPRNEEVKRQRRQFRNNEILSSLSSSMTIKPPHLQYANKRKAHNEDELQTLVSTKGKLLKFQSTPPSSKEEESMPSEIMQQPKEKVTTETESLQESPKQSIVETPVLKKVSAAVKSPTASPENKVIVKNAEAKPEIPCIFGRFPLPALDDDIEDQSSDFNFDEENGKNSMNKLTAPTAQEQMSRFKVLMSVVGSEDSTPDPIPIFNLNKPVTETVTSIDVATLKSPSILNKSTSGEKLRKSVTFSDPIEVTKVITNSEAGTLASTSSAITVPTTAGAGGVGGGFNSGSPSVSVLTSSNSGFSFNNTEPDETFKIPAMKSDVSKSSINFSVIPSVSASPNTVLFNSPSVGSDIFKPPSSLAAVAPSTQADTTPTFPKTVTNLVSIAPTKPLPSISFGATSTANPISTSSTVSAPVMFGSIATTGVSATPELSKTGGFTFSSAKKEPVKTVSSNSFGTNAVQSFSMVSGNTMFGSSAVKSTVTESKNMFTTSTSSSGTSTEPGFVLGSGNTSEPNQNKPTFGNVFGTVSSTSVADKTSSPFGNVFNPASTANSNPVLSVFGNNNTSSLMPTTRQSTTTIFPTTSANFLQSQSSINVLDTSKTNLQKPETSVNVFGGTASNAEIKLQGFGESKPAVTSSSNTFGSVFNASTPAQDSVTKPASFGGFGAPPVTAAVSPFTFGTPSSNQSVSVFGSVPTTSTTAPPAFSFGSNTTTNSVFGASMNNTPQTNSPFALAPSTQPALTFGTATPSTTEKPAAFAVTAKPNSGFALTSSSSQTAPAFGVTTANSVQPGNSVFTAPANSGFPALTNGTVTNSTFGSTFGTQSSVTPFTFGGSTNNTGGFSFGGTSTPASTNSVGGGFGTPVKPVAFNAVPPQAAVNAPTNVFTFGQQQPAVPASTQPKFQFSTVASQPSEGGFRFNPNAPTPTSNTFQIGSTAPASTPMFTLGSGTPRPKAVPKFRRLPK